LGSGEDTITDFQTSQDILDLGSYFDAASQALGVTTQIGNDAFIDLGDNNSITLTDIAVDSLTSDNFSRANLVS
ncbi:MAG: hypothetical protein AAGJ80_16950, partial [Cyanobacteria bacterium J06553_1]